MGKKKGRGLKNNKASIEIESSDVTNAPHSFVLHRGLPCPYIQDLTLDYRRMMEPFTASMLKERKNNKIKDFVSLSGVFHVSHMCIFNKTKNQMSFKVARLPRGPTLTFKVHQFTLARDVISSSRKQFVDEEAFHVAPLIIMNNFTGEGKHLKLMATTFQNMYPTINLATVQLSTVKRCVLISYNPVTELIDIRHFAITVAPVGLSRGVKKVVLGKVPNLSKCEDISDFLTGGYLTDSEFEDDETGQVVLPQTLKSRGNIENNKSAIKLHEIGPRLTIELNKIEDGLFTGEILYHRRVIKTEEELAEIKAEREKKKKLKEQRKRLQEQNTLNKEKTKEEHKQKSLSGMKAYQNSADQQEDDDDAAYYKEEVGEEPDADLFTMGQSRKRGYIPKFMHGKDSKRRKLDENKSKSTGFNKKDKYDGKQSKFGSGGSGGDKKIGGGKSSKFDGGRGAGDRKVSGEKSKFGGADKKSSKTGDKKYVKSKKTKIGVKKGKSHKSKAKKKSSRK